MVDARKNTVTPGLSYRERGTVLSYTGVLVVRGTSLSERGKKAPKSMGVLELI